MRKEIVFAMLAGILLGVVVAFGVWRVNTSINQSASESSNNSTAMDQNGDRSTDNNPTDGIDITLTKYENDDVITESPVTVSGITKPSSFVVISAEDEDYSGVADDKGEFSLDVDLVGGINDLVIKAFNDNGDSKEEDLRLVYSTEFAKVLDQQ
jgi:hypothetical protein